jgi:3-phenylpropionate/trans-cinnamate dioxygenase ferredoxin subunit
VSEGEAGVVANQAGERWTRVCSLDDLEEGKKLAVEVDGEPVAIVCSEDSVFAIRDMCSHASVPLSEGEVDGYTIECWMHGSCFDLRTGEPLNLPANVPVPVYPVKIDGADVLVSIDDENPVVAENVEES